MKDWEKMINKAIIMAGGSGTRLRPSTLALNKHLIPIYDKPLIYYSISLLMLLNIREILIIINKNDQYLFEKLLGNGEKFGLKIKFALQNKPSGIPEAFTIGEKFIKNKKSILILGDNIFHGQGLIELIMNTKKSFKKGANIFTYPVNNPEEFGVIELKKNKIKRMVEKPKKTNSNLAITGLYFFDKNVVEFAKKLRPSKRNETEIIEILKKYKNKNELNFTQLGRGSTWLDTGTIRNNLLCSNFIQIIEDRQNYKIGCIEEIAYRKKWINKFNLKKLIKNLGNNEYSKYLKSLIK